MPSQPDSRPQPTPEPACSSHLVSHDHALAAAASAASSIRYGDIRLTIHDGRIVQLEVTEKTRFSAS